MAQPPAQESPTPLLRAHADAPSLRVAPSASAAAYVLQPRQKQSALPAHQGSARTRRALSRCRSSKGRNPEIHPGESREPPQTFSPASNASALDPLATASCLDPQATKLTLVYPTPTGSPKSSLPASGSRPEHGLLLRCQPAPLLATSASSPRPFFPPRQAATPGHTLSLRLPPRPTLRQAWARKIQPTRNASKDRLAAKSNRCTPRSPWARPRVRSQDHPEGSSTRILRE